MGWLLLGIWVIVGTWVAIIVWHEGEECWNWVNRFKAVLFVVSWPAIFTAILGYQLVRWWRSEPRWWMPPE